jgi:uncharacterized spore protein YtfJ
MATEGEKMELKESVRNEAEGGTANSGEKFIGGLAEKLGARVRAATIFADPVERDGVTVIPVAKARWGFGGGTGRRKEEEGGGGGGGALVSPVGFIVLKNGDAEFRRIRTVSFPWAILGGLATLLILRKTYLRRKRLI